MKYFTLLFLVFIANINLIQSQEIISGNHDVIVKGLKTKISFNQYSSKSLNDYFIEKSGLFSLDTIDNEIYIVAHKNSNEGKTKLDLFFISNDFKDTIVKSFRLFN